MSIVAIKVKTGAVFDLYALELSGRCELLQFLSEICGSAPAEFGKLIRLFDWTTQYGTLNNKEKFKRLNADVQEFKTNGGVRVLCFRDGRSIIVLTNGFKKKKDYADEIARAEQLRVLYLNAKANDSLTYREEIL
jgi:hypothetical protein